MQVKTRVLDYDRGMKRRFFLRNTALSFVGILATSSAAFKLTTKLVGSEDTMLESNSICIAEPGKTLSLPKNAKANDYIHFAVDTNSVLNPAKIKYSGQKILGYDSDLELDVISNFKIVYHPIKGWVLS